MSDLKFFTTNVFLDALDRAGKLAPRAAAKSKSRIFGLKKYLDGIEYSWRDPDHLRWSHVDEARHIKKAYPPPEFGAFLCEIEKPLVFQSIEGLKDPDPEGYFARFRSRKFELACVVLYTEKPDRRLAFMLVGTLAECNKKLAALKEATQARRVISDLRALPKPKRTAR
ncbi:hypothetical protein [uncultured Roseobacter sp.]|uniref:hypothetical protein n=1 Tax=uncultured Roseobacter sp. TaxID=114847 RepID=UPI0026168948|nr:hypothetical protein [uncultured Roseobacter sp.]